MRGFDTNTDSYNEQLPESIVYDPQVISFGNVMDTRLAMLMPLIQKILVLCNIPNLTEDVLDLLAFQFQVLFYSQTFNISDDVSRIALKIRLISNSFDYHGRLGTPAVMQELITILYQNAYVQEWFVYGGTAHHFRVLTDNVISDPTIVADIGTTILQVKRASSTFEGFYTLSIAPPTGIFVATGVFVESFIQGPTAGR